MTEIELSEPCPVCGTVFDLASDQGVLDMTQHIHPETGNLAVEAVLARATEMIRMLNRVKRAKTDDEKAAIVQEWVEDHPA